MTTVSFIRVSYRFGYVKLFARVVPNASTQLLFRSKNAWRVGRTAHSLRDSFLTKETKFSLRSIVRSVNSSRALTRSRGRSLYITSNPLLIFHLHVAVMRVNDYTLTPPIGS